MRPRAVIHLFATVSAVAGVFEFFVAASELPSVAIQHSHFMAGLVLLGLALLLWIGLLVSPRQSP